MDKNNYITEGYRQLNNENHYEKVSEPINTPERRLK